MSNLTLIFNYEGNKISMQCNSNEKLNDVYNRFCSKVGQNMSNCAFYFNAKIVPPCNKTLENLQIKNFNAFSVVSNTVTGA